ncbi:MAG TPA: tetratricopeptide repeat protein [Methylomirabilota bacterium]|jgi:tetratricopeptide (TPR) repeat protein|nr:tetratricopeptide repeat protein [Methylomirabilota bacterium]
MRRRAFATLLGLLLLMAAPAVPAATPPSPSLVEAYKNVTTFHEDLARIDRARDLLEAEVARAPSLDALLLLAWAHLIWADYRAPSAEAKLASYERGRDVAKRAIEMNPKSPEAHLWYAANLGRWATTKGKLSAAFLLSTLKQEVQTILDLDPNHVPGLALAGSVYLEIPSMFGGDIPRAEGYLRKALGLDPHFTRARVELARCLIETGRYAEARDQLKQVIEERKPSYVADWVMRHRPVSERLLAEIRTK